MAVFKKKFEDAYPTVAPGTCSQFLLESDLFISYVAVYLLFCFFPTFFLLCVTVFPVWFLFLDYVLLISARIGVTWNAPI